MCLKLFNHATLKATKKAEMDDDTTYAKTSYFQDIVCELYLKKDFWYIYGYSRFWYLVYIYVLGSFRTIWGIL